MNFLGMGFMELAVILVIAFLVMGPARTIDMARNLGKLVGEARKTLADMTAAAYLNSADTPAPPRQPSSPQPPPVEPDRPPSGAIPTTGPGDGNEQQS